MMEDFDDSRIAFGMRDKLLVQCKDVIEILKSDLEEERVQQELSTHELSEARSRVQQLESELAATRRSLEDSESEKAVLQSRIEELLEKSQSLQNQCFLENKKRTAAEAKVVELAETLRQTQTRYDELANALIVSQNTLKDTVLKAGASDMQAFRELQERYQQTKQSEEELMDRLETLVQENDQLTMELMITKRKLELVEARADDHSRTSSPRTYSDRSIEEGLPAVDASGNLLPAPSSTPQLHFDEELERQRREHDELLHRMKRLMKDFRPRDTVKFPD